jgi:hypothetical protein
MMAAQSNIWRNFAMKKHLSIIAMLIILSLLFASCSSKKADYVDDGIGNIDLTDNSGSGADSGTYVYPDNPAEALRSYLQNEAKVRGLRLEVGDIRKTGESYESRTEFRVDFADSSDNAFVISFRTNDYFILDGKPNPSFTIAFKDPDNSQDMVAVLASVIKYVSPDLSLKEAEALAVSQDATLGIDGYAQPQDIGGYQVQARYTNPAVFIATSGFEAKLGVTVTAIKQAWGDFNASGCQKLTSNQDYRVIAPQYAPWEDDYQNKTVYADFIVKNVWHYDEWVHGDYWTEVDVESLDGNKYTLRLETMRMTADYEFGVGQQYTFSYYKFATIVLVNMHISKIAIILCYNKVISNYIRELILKPSLSGLHDIIYIIFLLSFENSIS